MKNWLNNNNKCILLIILLGLLFFNKILLNPSDIIYSNHSDIIDTFSAWKYFTAESLREYGELPLWNPYIFSGVTFIGNPQAMMFYPLFVFFYFFNTDSLFGFIFILHIMLAGIFMYFLMRYYKVSEVGSFIAAIIFMFNFRMITSIYDGQLPVIAAVIWIPLTFLLLNKLIKNKQVIYSILLGIILSIVFLAGHIQEFFYLSLILFLYLAYNFIFVIQFKRARVFSLFVFAFIVCILLSTVQLIPLLEFSQYSNRQGGINFEFSRSYNTPIQNLITLVLPKFFGVNINEYWGRWDVSDTALYFGIIGLFLSIIGIFLSKEKIILFFTGLTLFSILFSFGGLFYKFFFYLIPSFNLFRVPSRMLWFFVFAMAALAGFGFDHLERVKENKKISRILILVSFLTLFILFISYYFCDFILDFARKIGERYIDNMLAQGKGINFTKEHWINLIDKSYYIIRDNIWSFFIFICGLSFSFLLYIKGKINLKYFKIIVAIILIVDLWFYGMSLIETKDVNEVFGKNSIIEFLEKDEDKFRILDVDDILRQSVSMRNNLEEINGVDALILKHFLEFSNEITEKEENFAENVIGPKFKISEIKNYKIIDLLNIKYIISKNKTDYNGFKWVYMDKNGILYKNNNYLPRTFIVRNAKVIKNKEEIFKELKEFNPLEEIIIEEDFDKLNNKGRPQLAKIIYYSPNKIKINSYLDEPGFLLLSEMWYPGWKAFDNGKEIKIFKVDYALRAVYLEKGDHNVEFVYDPLSYKIGKWITIITIIILIGYFLFKR